jgi:hypothetical protein
MFFGSVGRRAFRCKNSLCSRFNRHRCRTYPTLSDVDASHRRCSSSATVKQKGRSFTASGGHRRRSATCVLQAGRMNARTGLDARIVDCAKSPVVRRRRAGRKALRCFGHEHARSTRLPALGLFRPTLRNWPAKCIRTRPPGAFRRFAFAAEVVRPVRYVALSVARSFVRSDGSDVQLCTSISGR